MIETLGEEADELADRHAIVRWFIVGLMVVVIALVVPIPFEMRAAAAAGDLVHAPLFALLAWALLRAWSRLRPVVAGSNEANSKGLVRRSMTVVAVLVAFGILMEFLQDLFGRSAAIHDAVANSIGAIAGALWFLSGALSVDPRQENSSAESQNNALQKYGLRLTAAGCIVISSWNPLWVLTDVVRMHLDFPLVASFESDMEMTRWHFNRCVGERVREGATDGVRAMKLTFDDFKHPGATLLDVPRDWSSCKGLSVDLYPLGTVGSQGNGEPTEIEFVLKVIDWHHVNYHSDVFRKTVWLRPGEPVTISATRAEIIEGPDGRELDLSNVKHISLQVLEPGRKVALLVDHITVQQ